MTLQIIFKLIYVILSFFWVFFLPGFFACRKFRIKGSVQITGMSIILSMAIVGTISISYALMLNKFVSATSILAIATISNMLLFSITPVIKRKTRHKISRYHIFAFILFLFVFIFFFLRYDINLFRWQLSCIQDAVDKVIGIHDKIDPGNGVFEDASDNPLQNLYRNSHTTIDNQRLGNTALISPFVALYKLLGFRIFYSVIMLLIAIFGFLTTEEVTKKRIMPFIGAVLFVFNPFVLSAPLANENLIAFALISAIVWLAIKKLNIFLVGFLFGLLCGVRDVSVFFAFALFYAFHWHYNISFKDYKKWLIIISGFLIAVFPYALWHYIAFGNILANESAAAFWPVVHKFLGIRFVYYGLLNFPFNEYIVRTMHNPYPAFLLFPFFLIRNFGLLLLSFAFLGALFLYRHHNHISRFLLLLFLPLYLFLSIQENWLEPNKMTYLFLVFTPILLFCLSGMEFLFTNKKMMRNILILATCLILLAAFFYSAKNLDFAADERIKTGRFSVQNEIPAMMDFEKSQYTMPYFLPDKSISIQYSPLVRSTQLEELGMDFLNDNYDIRLNYSANENMSNERVLLIDTSANPFKDKEWTSVTALPRDSIKIKEGESYLLKDIYFSKLDRSYPIVISREQNKILVSINQPANQSGIGACSAPKRSADIIPVNLRDIREVRIKYVLVKEIKYYTWIVDLLEPTPRYSNVLINFEN